MRMSHINVVIINAICTKYMCEKILCDDQMSIDNDIEMLEI